MGAETGLECHNFAGDNVGDDGFEFIIKDKVGLCLNISVFVKS